MDINKHFCDIMLTQGYGAILGKNYNSESKLYQTTTKAQLIAAMDVRSTLPLWKMLQEQNKLPDSGPILVTTQCTVEWKQNERSTYSIDIEKLLTNPPLVAINEYNKLQPRFEVNYHGLDAHTRFEYILLNQLPTSRHPLLYSETLQDQIFEHIITSDDLNHYGDGIVHGSWIINQLLTQLENKTNGLESGRKRQIKFHHPGKLDTVAALYHNTHQGFDLVSHSDHSHNHLIAQMKYLL